MAGIKIKDAPLIETLQGTDRIPASNNSGNAVSITVQQIKDFSLVDLNKNQVIIDIKNEIGNIDTVLDQINGEVI